jgi:hypothetical protein
VEAAFLGADMALRVLVGVLLLAAACYQPRVKNGGFSCKPTDVPACPDGYYCVDGWCRDTRGAIVPGGDLSTWSGDTDASNNEPRDLAANEPEHDLAGSGPHDLAGSGPHDLASNTPRDMAKEPPDLSPPRDMTQPRDLSPPPDLATGMCAHAGTPCTSNSECCSATCVNFSGTGFICIGG